MEEQVEVEPKPSREVEFHSRTNTLRQFRALFLKDLTLQWRSWATNLCQLLTPVIFIVFVGIIQIVINIILINKNTPIPGTETPFPPINPGKVFSCNKNKTDSAAPYHPTSCTVDVLNMYSYLPPGWELILDRLNLTGDIKNITTLLELFEPMSHEACQKELYDLPFFYIGTGDGVSEDVVGNLTAINSIVNRTGLVGNMVPDDWYFDFSLDFKPNYHSSREKDEMCPKPSKDSLALPLFWQIKDRETLVTHLGDIVKEYNKLANKSSAADDQYKRTYSVTALSETQYDTVMKYIKNGSRGLSKVKPQAGIFIDKYQSDASRVDIKYSLVADELALYRLPLENEGMGLTAENTSHIDVDMHRRNGLVNMMSNAILKDLRNATEEEEKGGDPYITTFVVGIPSEVQQNITVDVASIIGSILYPFSFSFLIPVFMSTIVKDKYERHLIMMEQNGLSRWTYWLVTYTFHYILYIPIIIEIIVFSLIFQIRIFTQTNYAVLLLTFFIWGHAEVVLGFFLSNFFSRPRTATIVGYFLVIVSVVIALLIAALQVFPNEKNPFFLYMMYPPFAFYRILMYFTNSCLEYRCYGLSTLNLANGLNIVTTAMLYLAGSTVLLMILSIYLSYVLPSDYGVRKSPFFPIIDACKWFKSLKKRASKRHSPRELSRSPPTTRLELEDDQIVDEDVDRDVLAEEAAIRDHFPDSAPMVMYRLRKEYPGTGAPYVAVDGMSLAINRNECFGLLGPNGAGKTTLISVLTGLYELTSGTARIAGYDLNTDIGAIHHHLGVCPQFDIHHAQLTAEEHLLFYARLKGVRRNKEKMVVERALRQVNLYDTRKKKSKNLSGGMKRRLSVAMACIGNPDILILDEPTTGLDPASRRQVWEVIETVKEGRSVILTTHAMEEADHLCTRIGIMNFGKLRCLGTQNHLKTKFGSGYQLTFNCAPGQAKDVEDYLAINLPNATHVETYADTCTFKMAKEHLRVSELFPMLNQEKMRLGILDWGVKMTTLEDVFLKIVAQHRDHRTRTSHSLLPDWLPCQHCLQHKKETVEE